MDDALRAKLDQVTSASLTDAVNKLRPHRAHALDLVSPTPGRVLFGPAATMLYAPVRDDVKERYEYNRVLADALGEDARGKVVVMAVMGDLDGAVVGGVRVASFDARGVAGLVTNARVRDFGELAEMRFATYCRGGTPRAGSRDIMPVAANVPVALDRATVLPGDYVHADAGGCVVIPASDIDAVIEGALAVEAKDKERMAKARGG